MQHDLNLKAFERADQIDEYLDCLRNRMLPLKFAYIKEAAYTHDILVRSAEYGLADTEARLIQTQFPSKVLPKLNSKGLNVIDVGSGNGIKALAVLNLLYRKVVNLRYAALDYSETLSNIALHNVLTVHPHLDATDHQVDFENGSFGAISSSIRSRNSYPILFLFLGHTLGNPVDRQKCLLSIRASMEANDSLLVGVEMFQPTRVGDILSHYQNEPFYRAVFFPLTFAGLTREDGALDVSFNKRMKDVEVWFEMGCDFTLRVGMTDAVQLTKGERICMFVSHRFTEGELQKMFERARLHIREIMSDEGKTYALIFAGPSDAAQHGT